MNTQQTEQIGSPEWIERKSAEIQAEEDLQESESTPARAHSPLPWHHRIETSHTRCAVTDYRHLEICEVYGIDRETRNANAAFIVRACNERPNLKSAVHHMEACRSLLDVPNDDVLYQSIKDLKAHAQRLADALGKMLKLNIVPTIENVGAAIEARGEKHSGLTTVRAAREALAQWEGSK